MALPPPAAKGPRIFCLTAHSPYTFGDEQGRDRRDRPCVELQGTTCEFLSSRDSFGAISLLFTPFSFPVSLALCGKSIHARSFPGTLHIFLAVWGSSVLCGWLLWVVLFLLLGVYFILFYFKGRRCPALSAAERDSAEVPSTERCETETPPHAHTEEKVS